MRRVLSAVEMGNERQIDIVVATGLRVGQVVSALWNLTFIGALVRLKDRQGRSIYVMHNGRAPVALCLCGVRSIFDVR